jgi:hypothetical protein
MEDVLNFFQMKDNLIFIQVEYDLNLNDIQYDNTNISCKIKLMRQKLLHHNKDITSRKLMKFYYIFVLIKVDCKIKSVSTSRIH